MSDDETKNEETTDEASEAAADAPTVEEPSVEEAPAAEAESDDAPAAEQEEAPAEGAESAEEPAAEQEDEPAAEAAEAAPEAEPEPGDDLPWKERRRLQRSREPHEPRPALSPEERAAARREARATKAAGRRKERAGAKAKKGPAGTGTVSVERESNAAKVRQGIVVSNKGNKSITVRIDFARRHPTYEKIVRRSRTLHAHDERNEAGEGDVVRVIETRPLSKTKRWRLVDIVEKAR